MPVPAFLKSKAGIFLIITVTLGVIAITCVTCGVVFSPYFLIAGCASAKKLNTIPQNCQFSEQYCNLHRQDLIQSGKTMNAAQTKAFVTRHGSEPEKLPHCPSVWLAIVGLILSGVGWMVVVAVMIVTIVKPAGRVTSILLFVTGGVFTAAVVLFLIFFVFMALSNFPCKKIGNQDVYYSVVTIFCTEQRNNVYQLVPLILGTIFVGGTAVAAFLCGWFLRSYTRRRLVFADNFSDEEGTAKPRLETKFEAKRGRRSSTTLMSEEERAQIISLIKSQGRRLSTKSSGSVTAMSESRKKRNSHTTLKKSLEALAFMGQNYQEEESEDPKKKNKEKKKKGKKDKNEDK